MLHYLRDLVRGTVAIAGAELALLRRFPRTWLAILAVGLVPALYSLIYLTSVWDPNGHTGELPVGLVNEDQGIHYMGRHANVGAELSQILLERPAFGFRAMAHPEEARQAVRRGELAFALLIPPNFSANAVPGIERGAGELVIYTSEGNNYSSAGLARRFASEVGHQVNEMLNEQRWALVLDTASSSQDRLTQLRRALAQLRDGAHTLSTGSRRYSDAASQVGEGFKEVNGGIRHLASHLPPPADLKALRSGAQQLSAGQRELGSGLSQIGHGLDQLDTGAGQLLTGARQMQSETESIWLVGDRVSAGAGQLADGASHLQQGLQQARSANRQAQLGNQQLQTGAVALESGVVQLTDGLQTLGDGVQKMSSKLPSDRQLDEFSDAGVQLAHGAQRLLLGLQTVEAALPRAITRLEGNASGLAESVAPQVQVDAPVANNGVAFIPNMVSVALWIGAVMAGYLFNMGLVLHEHDRYPRLAKALGKMVLPAAVVLLQVAWVELALLFVLDVRAPRVAGLGVTMALAAVVFLAVLSAVVQVFGDFGRILSVLLLTLQLSAGGGVLPVELSAGFFRAVHDWLPFSWVVQAFRAVLFGAYDQGWGHACAMVVLSGLVAVALMALFGRWGRVGLDAYQPTVKL
ncbi:YhgE/Pip domain-containing protein [Curvibacter sp. HBC61]|uniref:YhgE/Pip domain-containing protein n=1 Tax=Curvibacter cyanobacteriorum TaxID=3026422 RepID=A0ABT5MY19_9BURK|nr:YhgE/Pip domain-containing protein [Curvibacter sp. HBC61]MDD0838900.1 YhgE/Pip domain-containing protein [Curvibacter sp. HBC61]